MAYYTQEQIEKARECWHRAEIAKYISERIANIHQKEIANAAINI